MVEPPTPLKNLSESQLGWFIYQRVYGISRCWIFLGDFQLPRFDNWLETTMRPGKPEENGGFSWENHRKTIGKWRFTQPGYGKTVCELENGHRNSGFSQLQMLISHSKLLGCLPEGNPYRWMSLIIQHFSIPILSSHWCPCEKGPNISRNWKSQKTRKRVVEWL